MGNSTFSQSFNLIFTILCLIATCFAVFRCFQTYLKNEDVCLVSFKRFNDNPDQIYPTITICILNPIQQEKLDRFGNGSYDVTSFNKYLKGELENKEFEKHSYDDATVNLEDYLLNYKVISPDKLIPYQDMSTYGQNGWKGPYVSFRKEEIKCFSFDIPYNHKENVFGVVINLNSSIFRNRTRPNEWPSQPDIPGVSFTIHMKSQMLLSYSTMKSNWDFRGPDSSKNYSMEFHINTMDLVSYRSKKYEPCIADWKNYDRVLYEELMNKIGCQVRYWKLNNTIRYCTRKEEFDEIDKYFFDILSNNIRAPPPCRTIKQAQYQYKDSEISNQLMLHNHTDVNFVVNFLKLNHHFKEIMQVEAYSAESLLGNIFVCNIKSIILAQLYHMKDFKF